MAPAAGSCDRCGQRNADGMAAARASGALPMSKGTVEQEKNEGEVVH